ncbi:MAG: hypothetical protein IPI57_15405 [Candidatus Competibacteraceae bacterium]|nr:hypothetical protein [Candidatus Competibacteraceae bacterium]
MKKIFILALIALPISVYGAGCEDYPYTDGVSTEEVPGGTKVLSTSSVSVNFDDMDSVRDAKDEATIMAKAGISKWLTEDINSDEAINRTVNENKSMTGQVRKSNEKSWLND